MFRNTYLRRAFAWFACVAFLAQQTAVAANPQFTIVDGVKVHRSLKHVAMDASDFLNGTIVDSAGKPIRNADVLIGQQGKVVASAKTDESGRYRFAKLKPGFYQVASFAGVQTFKVYRANEKPAGALAGVVQVMSDRVLRGQSCGSCDSPGCDGCGGGGGSGALANILKNPITWAIVIAAAIAIPLALDDDDGS